MRHQVSFGINRNMESIPTDCLDADAMSEFLLNKDIKVMYRKPVPKTEISAGSKERVTSKSQDQIKMMLSKQIDGRMRRANKTRSSMNSSLDSANKSRVGLTVSKQDLQVKEAAALIQLELKVRNTEALNLKHTLKQIAEIENQVLQQPKQEFREELEKALNVTKSRVVNRMAAVKSEKSVDQSHEIISRLGQPAKKYDQILSKRLKEAVESQVKKQKGKESMMMLGKAKYEKSAKTVRLDLPLTDRDQKRIAQEEGVRFPDDSVDKAQYMMELARKRISRMHKSNRLAVAIGSQLSPGKLTCCLSRMVDVSDLFAITQSLAKAQIIKKNISYRLAKLKQNLTTTSDSENDQPHLDQMKAKIGREEDYSVDLFPLNMSKPAEVWKADGRITNLMARYLRFKRLRAVHTNSFLEDSLLVSSLHEHVEYSGESLVEEVKEIEKQQTLNVAQITTKTIMNNTRQTEDEEFVITSPKLEMNLERANSLSNISLKDENSLMTMISTQSVPLDQPSSRVIPLKRDSLLQEADRIDHKKSQQASMLRLNLPLLPKLISRQVERNRLRKYMLGGI